MSAAARGRVVEGRAGSLARVEGSAPRGEGGPIEMSAWKDVVARSVAESAPLGLVYAGGANLITGYRLYYMLQRAKGAGVRDLTLFTDGAFWIDEATDWLIECGLDRLVLCVPGGVVPDTLADRVRDLRARTSAGAGGPVVDVRAAAPGVTTE